VFRRLASREEALERIRRYVKMKPLRVEDVELTRAHGRVLAVDVKAPIDVPQFPRATMDGYAVRSQDTFGASEENPLELKVTGRVDVGEKPSVVVGPGEAVEVATGSAIPDGADAVVPVEWTRGGAGGSILVLRGVASGENVMEVGRDIRRGDVVLRRGTRLTPTALGVLSALGMPKIKVYAKPRVAILSTGRELVEPGGPLADGRIYDVNWITLYASVEECGGEPIFLGVAGDDPKEISGMLRKGLGMADLVLVSGGTSVGATDLMRNVVDGLGEPGVIVDGVRMKPGKPTIIGVVGSKPIFCLPGNPTSALVSFHNFAAPVIRAMAALPETRRLRIKARMATRLIPASGRLNTIPVRLETRGGGVYACPILRGSGAITSLALADGYVEIPEDVKLVEEGEEVQVHLFHEWGAGVD